MGECRGQFFAGLVLGCTPLARLRSETDEALHADPEERSREQKMPESAPTVHQLVEEAERVQSGHDPGPDPDRTPPHRGEEDRGAVPPPQGDRGHNDGLEDDEGDEQTEHRNHVPSEPADLRPGPVHCDEVVDDANRRGSQRHDHRRPEGQLVLEREGGGHRGIGVHVISVSGKFPTANTSTKPLFCQGIHRFLDVAEQVVLSLVQL